MTSPDRPDEFALIDRCFAPLAAANPGALGLRDDAGLIQPQPGHEIVVTVDTLVAEIHFRSEDPAGQIAQKLLRVSLSDLAAMGARPVTYLVAASLPRGIDGEWLAEFAAGLARDQDMFGVNLLGGDTTATPGPMSLTLTAIGEVPLGQAVRRSGATVGDEIYVSGTIGDAALGLEVLQKSISAPQASLEFLAGRYLLPRPRVALGVALRGVASAMADVSDGLVADLGHICTASGVGAIVTASLVPLSDEARCLVEERPALRDTILTGGDDYELVFAASRNKAEMVAAAAAETGVAVTKIGAISAGAAVEVYGDGGTPISFNRPGYRHF